MSIRRFVRYAAAFLLLTTSPVLAQRQQSQFYNVARERAMVPYEDGMSHLRNEAFDAAIKSFQKAIDLDGSFEEIDPTFLVLVTEHERSSRATNRIGIE